MPSTKTNQKQEDPNMPFFKTVDVMSRISGIGENRLRQMINDNEIDYIEIGNRKLLADKALWDWYERSKVRAAAKVRREVSRWQSTNAR